MGLEIAVTAEIPHPLDELRLEAVVRRILADHGMIVGSVSIAIVGDETIHKLNRQHLNHDYTTDVLSFDYTDDDADAETIDGELIVNAEMAVRDGPSNGLTGADELMLYAIHGTLHLCGYDDHTDAEREKMWAIQQKYLDAWRP